MESIQALRIRMQCWQQRHRYPEARSIAPSLADDKELEAIFVRTYGEIKRRKPQKERTFRGSDEINPGTADSAAGMNGTLSDTAGKGSWRGEKRQKENRTPGDCSGKLPVSGWL